MRGARKVKEEGSDVRSSPQLQFFFVCVAAQTVSHTISDDEAGHPSSESR